MGDEHHQLITKQENIWHPYSLNNVDDIQYIIIFLVLVANVNEQDQISHEDQQVGSAGFAHCLHVHSGFCVFGYSSRVQFLVKIKQRLLLKLKWCGFSIHICSLMHICMHEQQLQMFFFFFFTSAVDLLSLDLLKL